MLKLASCDSQGVVYIGKDAVYRTIESDQVDNVLELIEVVGGCGDGIIETQICAIEDQPLELAGQSKLVLKHRKVEYISYPHEWCAAMFKDAAIFHVELCIKLLVKNLYLKDAHPWNIMFDRGYPVFVDFTSIVKRKRLFEEEYLEFNHLHKDMPGNIRLAKLVQEIYTRMYQPYFIRPMMFYACGERDRVRPRIQDTTLNASTSIINLIECLPKFSRVRSAINKTWRLHKANRSEKRAVKAFRERMDIKRFYSDLRKQVLDLHVEFGQSAYSLYYQQKGEDHNKEFSDSWNAKQKSVYQALNSPEIISVLDVACNTGWFALMAEKMGKSVVAFDIDEGCIELLYTQVRDERLNVLPLVMNFTQLTPDRYSIHDGKKVLINANDRLRSDSVIALGIIHHLVLGLGMSFDGVLDSLTSLSKKQMVIEFVEKEDAMIRDEPEFFQAYFKDRSIISSYDLQLLVGSIEERGFDVSIQASYPETRKMLVCNRKVRT
jgi:SAM-dependent methyltransferase